MSDKQDYITAIRNSGFTIYDPIEVADPDLWIPTPVLQGLLNDGLAGMLLQGLPLRTRSKVVKQAVCHVLGYPVPRSFKKTQPRFPGQQFDTYIQKSNNLQIWNEEISATRRYVIIQVSSDFVVERVKVVTGDVLALLDKTGTLTGKYQARLVPRRSSTELIVAEDTDNLKPLLKASVCPAQFSHSPISYPAAETLLPISTVFERLAPLVGIEFADAGRDQERNRGAELHRIVCLQLGYSDFRDDGQFPDLRHQLLEVKLQTSGTIDLGLVLPNSGDPLELPRIQGRKLRHCDVRYAVFYGRTDGKQVTLSRFYLTTGEAFFSRFPQFQGKAINKKLQIPLPRDFFDL